MAAEDDENPLRSIGSALGGFARRVGSFVAEVSSGQTSVPDALKGPLEAATAARLSGNSQAALAPLTHLGATDSLHPAILVEKAMTLAAHGYLRGAWDESWTSVATELDARGASAPEAALDLVHGISHLLGGRVEVALDDLRRARRRLPELRGPSRGELALWTHLWLARAFELRGEDERALREVEKARAALPATAGPAIHELVLAAGVELSLTLADPRGALEWLRSSHAPSSPGAPAQAPDAKAPDARAPDAEVPAGSERDDTRALRALALAASGHEEALALAQDLPDAERFDDVRLRVALGLGHVAPLRDETRALAFTHLQRAALRPERLRWYGLLEFLALERDRDALDDASYDARANTLLDALVRGLDLQPKGKKPAFRDELAHVALRLGCTSDRVMAGVASGDDPIEEARLLAVRAALDRNDLAATTLEFQGDAFRASAPPAGPVGPDAFSPLRDTAARDDLLAAQRALVAGQRALLLQHRETALDFLVEALRHDPGLERAEELLGALAVRSTSGRLEDLLVAATDLLSNIPPTTLGVSLTGVHEALARVVSARERLSRPLTIAIMGEFSSGKSTFVNALIGEELAPVGVLPTTSTINVFRRAARSGARVHYRDDRMELVEARDIAAFLRGIDDAEAARIRYVEIDHDSGRLGDAAVVDTPGLNALDTYHERVAREFIEQADAVVWVFSATRGGTGSEAGMLSALRAGGRKVLGVLNKVDTLEPDERAELTAYLRDQLGDVLTDVIPLCAREALTQRLGGREASSSDAFAAVEHALETHFFRRARDLKRSLTKRQLEEALSSASAAVDVAASALEAQARAAEPPERSGDLSARATLRDLADRTYEALLELDEPWTRELLALGFQSGAAQLRRTELEASDRAYLGLALERTILDVVRDRIEQQRVGDVEGSRVAVVAETHLLTWLRGYVAGIVRLGFVDRLVREAARASEAGERGVRTAIRQELRPHAESVREQILVLGAEVRASIRRDLHARRNRPRAEALRLRGVLGAGLTRLRKVAAATDAG